MVFFTNIVYVILVAYHKFRYCSDEHNFDGTKHMQPRLFLTHVWRRVSRKRKVRIYHRQQVAIVRKLRYRSVVPREIQQKSICTLRTDFCVPFFLRVNKSESGERNSVCVETCFLEGKKNEFLKKFSKIMSL